MIALLVVGGPCDHHPGFPPCHCPPSLSSLWDLTARGQGGIPKVCISSIIECFRVWLHFCGDFHLCWQLGARLRCACLVPWAFPAMVIGEIHLEESCFGSCGFADMSATPSPRKIKLLPLIFFPTLKSSNESHRVRLFVKSFG